MSDNENTETQALATTRPEPSANELAIKGAGTFAMAQLSDVEFADRLAALKRGAERIKIVKKELMQPGVHYGVIPGTDKPTLLKPGAEALCSIFSLRANFIPNTQYGDGVSAPPIRVEVRCELHLGSLDGPVIAVGYGSASTWERKHRYRAAEKTCPVCNRSGCIIKGKAEYGGGWMCWAKKGGCGAKWADGAAVIEKQVTGMVENPDQHDLENTCLKMAEKRCLAGTVPLFYHVSELGVVRGDVEDLFAAQAAGDRTFHLPGPDGSWRQVTGIVRNEPSAIQRLDLADGSYVRATPEHRFPTTRGLLPVSELQPGDKLIRSAIFLPTPEWPADPELGWVAGLFIADGNFSNNEARFTLNAKDELAFADRILAVACKLGGTGRAKVCDGTLRVGTTGPIVAVIRQFVDGETSHNKHFSKQSWRQGPAFVRSMLLGYLDGDGSRVEREGHRPFWAVGFTGDNRELAMDLRAACAVVGWRVKMARSNARFKGVTYPTFRGWIKDQEPAYHGMNLEEITDISTEPLLGPTFDIEVSGDHLFCLSDGIQTHNSYLDATLRGTASSDLFTQDMDETIPPDSNGAPPESPAAKKPEVEMPRRKEAASAPAPAATPPTIPASVVPTKEPGTDDDTEEGIFHVRTAFVAKSGQGWTMYAVKTVEDVDFVTKDEPHFIVAGDSEGAPVRIVYKKTVDRARNRINQIVGIERVTTE